MSQYLEALEIIDGRILCVLTDEALQELGVRKRLHRLVLINKIAKEKARSQMHVTLHTALSKLVNLQKQMADGTVGEIRDQHDRNIPPEARAASLYRRVNELVSCLPPQELVLEFRAKLAVGGALCELLLHSFVRFFLPKVAVAAPGFSVFADSEVVNLLVARLKERPMRSNTSVLVTLETLFLTLRLEENRAAAVAAGVIAEVRM